MSRNSDTAVVPAFKGQLFQPHSHTSAICKLSAYFKTQTMKF